MKYSKKIQERINTNLRNNCMVGTKYDTFKYNESETLSHNLALAKQFIYLRSQGFCVAVRPVLKNKNIPDILILSSSIPYIKEIMVTETEKRFEEKNYLNIPKIKVRVNQEIEKAEGVV